MSFSVLAYYEQNREIVDLLTDEDKVPLFMLFLIHRNGPMSIEELRHHTGIAEVRLQQIVARLAGSNLLTLAGGHVATSEDGESILDASSLLERAASAKGLDVGLPKVKVIGIGGGGCNAISRLMRRGVEGIELIALNSDAFALERATAHSRVLIGNKLLKGLGAGGNPEVGQRAALESKDDILKIVQGADMVFIVAGMGGGTGSGAAPVVAKIAREVASLTLAVVSKPFSFEGQRRMQVAEKAIASLNKIADTVIVIPNDTLLTIMDSHTTVDKAFKLADSKLSSTIRQATAGIAELITVPGVINIDFADVIAIMGNAGTAVMAIGRGSGERRATEAAKAAVQSLPLDKALDRATGVLFSISGGKDLTLSEVDDAARVVAEAVRPDANIIFGVAFRPELGNDVQITLIAAGIREETRKAAPYLEEFLKLKVEEELEGPPFLRRVYPARRIVARIK